jgi:hypothetical protein
MNPGLFRCNRTGAKMERMRSVPRTCRGLAGALFAAPPTVVCLRECLRSVETWAVIRVALGQRAENNIPIQHKKK